MVLQFEDMLVVWLSLARRRVATSELFVHLELSLHIKSIGRTYSKIERHIQGNLHDVSVPSMLWGSKFSHMCWLEGVEGFHSPSEELNPAICRGLNQASMSLQMS